MLVSIIIPCKNVENYVCDAIDSALAQSYRPIEIILVDNNSSDGTWNILSSYQQLQPELIKCFKESKPGAPAARNKGLSKAKGEWIQFLDADDILLPSKIRKQMLVILNNPYPISLLVGSSFYQDFEKSEEIRVPDERNEWLSLIKGTLGDTCANLWSKKILNSIGGWNETQESSQEYELMFRILKKSARIKFHTQPLVVIRRRVNSISTIDKEGNRERAARIHLEMYNYIYTTNPLLVSTYKSNFQTAALKHISKLALFDPDLANTYYKKWISTEFRLEDPGFGRFYLFCYNVFGYKTAQHLYQYYLSVRTFFIRDR